MTITLRGTEVPLSKFASRREKMLVALSNASRIFSVSDSLKQHVIALGADSDKIRVVGNGIALDKFYPLDKAIARAELNIAKDAKVLISVGALVDRKGFHRVIALLPELLKKYPTLS